MSVVQTDVAFVRLDSGDVAQLEQGASLPEGVADDERARLTAAGVLGDAQPQAPVEDKTKGRRAP